MILLFKMDSKFSAEVVSSILMFKKAVIRLTKKNSIRWLCLVMSYSTVSCEFNVHESVY